MRESKAHASKKLVEEASSRKLDRKTIGSGLDLVHRFILISCPLAFFLFLDMFVSERRLAACCTLSDA